MNIKISDIPTKPVDVFLPEHNYKRTGYYFHARFVDGVYHSYAPEWKPIGKSYSDILLAGSKDSNVTILFENSLGERTWFHFFDDTQPNPSSTGLAATAPQTPKALRPRRR